MSTLTSKYTPTELYELILWTIKNSGNGGDVFLTSTNDLIEVVDNEVFIITLSQKVDGEQYVTSRKQVKLYDLYLLFELFENAIDADETFNTGE